MICGHNRDAELNRCGDDDAVGWTFRKTCWELGGGYRDSIIHGN